MEKNNDSRTNLARKKGRLIKPASRSDLRDWVHAYAGMRLPDRGTCPNHCTPLDYLEHVFFEQGDPADTVVWACRGGGKTMIGAAATLLDLLFKPGIQIRILGGSKDQSQFMYNYLCSLIGNGFADQLAGKITGRGFSLANGSRVQILTQSQTSVRGTRVQKLRCDELDLFKDSVWDAAQLTTRSIWVEEPRPDGDTGPSESQNPQSKVRGAVEVFSTMHRPSGLMSRLVARTACPLEEMPGGTLEAGLPRKVFAWCIWDVIEECRHEDRTCDGCVLFPDCRSQARNASGFVPVEDVIRFHDRAARRTWENEMLCHVPFPENQVFPTFRRDVHVKAFPARRAEPGQSVELAGRSFTLESVAAGIDYGWRKFVCLWIAMLRDAAGRRAAWVVDEYVMAEKSLESHAAAIRARGQAWTPAAYHGDAAGRQHDAHSGQTSEALLRNCGITVKSRVMRIDEGLLAIDRLIEPPEAWGRGAAARFFVDPRCANLIEALCLYARKNDSPVKDGEHDHLVDALRYAIAGHDGVGGKVEMRGY